VTGSPEIRLGHRPHLDGIRALAILAVLGYHFGPWLPGGFLGVDVFFALSGFLIGSLLAAELDSTGRIDFPRFWARRARRLLPPVVALVLIVAFATWATGRWEFWAERRADLAATLLYVANWHFIRVGADYFAGLAGSSAVLHTWSLAVEEQFYILWPLIFVAAARLNARIVERLPFASLREARRPAWLLVGGVLALAGVSILIERLLYVPSDPNRAYLGTDARGHQLLLGVAAALVVRPWLSPPGGAAGRIPWIAGAAQLAIVAALGASILLAQPEWSGYYRGFAAVFAALVVALIVTLEVQPRALVGRILGSPPFRWVGTRSYGLYIYHWPVVLALAATSEGGVSLVANLAGLALTVAVAEASYRFLEQPIRQGRFRLVGRSTRRTFVAAGVGLAACGAIAFVATEPRIWLQSAAAQSAIRVPPDAADQVLAAKAAGARWVCPTAAQLCVRVPIQGGGVTVVTVGDSWIGALEPGFVDWAQRTGAGFVQAANAGCSVSDAERSTTVDHEVLAQEESRCRSRRQRIHAAIGAIEGPVLVVATSIFEQRPIVRSDGSIVALGTQEHHDALVAGLVRAIDQMAGTRGDVTVALIEPVTRALPPSCATSVGLIPDRGACDEEAIRRSDAAFEEVARAYRAAAAQRPSTAVLITIDDLMCGEPIPCDAWRDGNLVRWDGTHVTAAFARELVPRIIRRVNDRHPAVRLPEDPPVAGR
jgi:peptidoglycan/LPS O-acetylase OafA/YrhL